MHCANCGTWISARRTFGPGPGHDQIGVLRTQLLKLLVPLDGGLHRVHFIGRQVARDVLALFVGLMIVIRPVRALAQHVDRAT